MLKKLLCAALLAVAAAFGQTTVVGGGVTLPANASGCLSNNGSGTLSWAACGGASQTWPAGAGVTVYAGSNAWGTSLTAPAGALVGTTATQTLTNKTLDGVSPATMAFMDAVSSIQTQLDGKQATLTTGNLTEATSAVLTLAGGTGAVIGSGTTIQVKQATTGQAGYLSSTDWNTFNNKQAALSLPSGAIVGTTDTQTLTNKTVDGVAPATFAFLDPSSSVQTQLNSITTSISTLASTSLTDTANIGRLNAAQTFSAANTFSAAGAASTPTVRVSGAVFTTGSGTTNQPQTYLDATGGGSQPTNWNAAGTLLGGNAVSGFTGDLLDFKVNGTNQLILSGSGTLTIAGRIINGGGYTGAMSTKTGNYTVTSFDDFLLGDATGGAFTFTLPSSPGTGQIVTLKKIDSSGNAVTISRNGKSIEGAAADLSLATQFQTYQIQYNGTAWFIKSKF